MKTWAVPGESSPAEWGCLSYDTDWEKVGGIWAKELSSFRFVVIVVMPHVQEVPKFFGYAKVVDLTQLSLVEVHGLVGTPAELSRDVLGTAQAVLEKSHGAKWPLKLLKLAVLAGKGVTTGSYEGATVTTIRTKLKTSVEPPESIPEASPLEFRIKYRDNARLKNPKLYAKGFLQGMRCMPQEEGTSGPERAGWEHGLDYATGKVALPNWFSMPSIED